jgi:hypothetical protein
MHVNKVPSAAQKRREQPSVMGVMFWAHRSHDIFIAARNRELALKG